MKKIALVVLLFFSFSFAYSMHLKGGWIYYEYLGKGSSTNTSKYRITVNQYLLCTSQGQQIDANVFLGVFDGASNVLEQVITIPHTNTVFEEKKKFDPCINNPPTVCYRIDKYVITIDLSDNNAGYILNVQRCCRIGGIVNINNSQNVGITYTTRIPGIVGGVIVRNNNSPLFAQKDTAIVCVNSFFTFDFSATDLDGDSLSYSFCNGLTGGDPSAMGTQPNPPTNPPPPFVSLSYAGGFTGQTPMGQNVTIDSHTGIISGNAPGTTGDYVVAVCASEYRNGIYIGQTKKEIHINVSNCQLSGAKLKPSYITCNGFDFLFQNESTASNITSYHWDFGVPTVTNDTSNLPKPTYTYADTGAYTIKLKVANSQGCSDSASSVLKIYPGFIPDFSVTGSCFLTPFNFFDATSTVYGFVDTWHWDFGDVSTNTDTSTKQNDQYQYPASGTHNVTLIVTNSKGCIDTITKQINAFDKPVINIPFHDTLICVGDSLKLFSSVSGVVPVYSWSPVSNISNPNIANPTVFPTDTTTYFLNVNDKGCINNDSIKVNVIPFVTAFAGNDTTICRGDSIILNAVTNGLYFSWSPTASLNDAAIKNPLAFPLTTTTYSLLSSVGKCNASGNITVRVVPYPTAFAGLDTAICFGNTTQLNANITGSQFTWSPANSLQNSHSLNPIAGPQTTTTYILTVNDTLGCPKPATDSVTIKVIPPIKAFAGNDTTIVENQPLQLNATGGTIYTWSPTTGMNDPNIPNPIVIITNAPQTIVYRVRVSVPELCFAFDDIKVTVFKTVPSIFIPTAFTPNHDGLNDILKPILAGMKNLRFFRVFNRWGQLVYSTSEIGKGWNGTLSGAEEPSGTYVFEAEAEDYLGNLVFKKGTVVLIR